MSDKKKNIVKINRKELSTQQISEKENLDGILNKHRMLTKRPVYKQKRFYFFLFLVLVITLLIYYTEKESENKENQTTEETN